MKVLISDGKDYISRDAQNRYSLTTDKGKATSFEEASAANVINHSLKNIKLYAKKNWIIKSIADTENEEIHMRIFENKSESELLRIIEDALEAYCEMEYRREDLVRKLYEKTKRRDDLEHTIENIRFNAYQGYSFCKELQTVSRERRIIKKNVLMMDIVRNESIFPNITKVKDAISRLKEVEAADTYYYRISKEYGKSVRYGQTYRDLETDL